MAQALRNSIVDCVLYVGQAWRTLSYSRNLVQELTDQLNSSGFRVLALDDSNLALLSGGSLKARVQILTDGYASERDAASVVAGAASALGFNVQSFTGALVANSAVTYPNNVIGSGRTTTGLPSLGESSGLLVAAAVVLAVVILARR